MTRKCHAKQFFPNAVAARYWMMNKSRERIQDGVMKVSGTRDFYKCQFCCGWHLTSPFPNGATSASESTEPQPSESNQTKESAH